MPARLAPPALIEAPPAWATLTDALLAELLAQRTRHDLFPMPGIPQVARWVPDDPALVAELAARRKEG